MKPIIYKTYPRLLFLSTSFLGAIFFGLLSWFIWTISKSNRAPIIYVILAIFVLGSIFSFYYFITIKVIKLSIDSIKISYFMLPFQKTFLLSEIKSLSQQSKLAEVNRGFLSPITFTILTTTIHFNDGKEMKLQTVSNLDFQELEKGFQKFKSKNENFTPRKRTFFLYMIDNIDGLGLVILMAIVTIGLTYGLLTRH
jgi:hypothetical protein